MRITGSLTPSRTQGSFPEVVMGKTTIPGGQKSMFQGPRAGLRN